MKAKQYLPLIQAVSSLSIIDKTDDFPGPANDSSPIGGVRIQKDYKCNHCDDMLTMNESYMSKHIFNKHPGVRSQAILGIDELLFRPGYAKENTGPLSIPTPPFSPQLQAT